MVRSGVPLTLFQNFIFYLNVFGVGFAQVPDYRPSRQNVQSIVVNIGVRGHHLEVYSLANST